MKLDGYETLLKDISVELRRYLISKGVNKDMAEDVVQDVFVKVLEMDLILPPDKIRPYMYKIARTRYIDLYRRDAHLKEILQLYLIPEKKAVDISDAKNSSKKLQHTLNKLSSEDQDILKMKYIDNHSIDQIAMKQKTTPAAIKMRLYRLRKRIRKGFGDSK